MWFSETLGFKKFRCEPCYLRQLSKTIIILFDFKDFAKRLRNTKIIFFMIGLFGLFSWLQHSNWPLGLFSSKYIKVVEAFTCFISIMISQSELEEWSAKQNARVHRSRSVFKSSTFPKNCFSYCMNIELYATNISEILFATPKYVNRLNKKALWNYFVIWPANLNQYGYFNFM